MFQLSEKYSLISLTQLIMHSSLTFGPKQIGVWSCWN